MRFLSHYALVLAFNDVKVFVILQKLFLQISSQVHCKCLAKVARFSTVCLSRKQLTDS